MTKPRSSRPSHIGEVLSHLSALRGLGRVRAQADLAELWESVAGADLAAETRVLGLRRGTLVVGVSSSVRLAELVGFHRSSLLEQLQQQRPDLRLRELRFKLHGGTAARKPSG